MKILNKTPEQVTRTCPNCHAMNSYVAFRCNHMTKYKPVLKMHVCRTCGNEWEWSKAPIEAQIELMKACIEEAKA